MSDERMTARSRRKQAFARIRAFSRDHAIDAVGIAGAATIAHGVDLIFHPLGFIAAGGFLLAGAWLSARQA